MNSMMDLFAEHEAQFDDLLKRLLEELPNVLLQYPTSDSDLFDLAQVFADRGWIIFDLILAFLFRHFKKSEFNLEAAVSSALTFFEWRLSTDAAQFDLDLLPQDYMQRFNNGFCVITDGFDKKLRPLLYIKLDQVRGMQAEVLRSHLQFVMEMCRRLIFYLNQDQEGSYPHLFLMSVLVDVSGVGIGHFNLEFLPCLREIFSVLFPQSFGCIYVLNYGWVHAGLWSIIKQLLTPETKERLLFLDNRDLEKYISIENIPQGRMRSSHDQSLWWFFRYNRSIM